MSTPTAYIKKLQGIDVDRLVYSVFNSNEIDKEATDLLREQWEKGENKQGNPIGYYASASYARKKHDMNPLAGLGIVDLMLTHALERGLYLEVQGDSFEFKSSDSKFADLKDRYPLAWGLAEWGKADLRQIFQDFLVRRLREIL